MLPLLCGFHESRKRHANHAASCHHRRPWRSREATRASAHCSAPVEKNQFIGPANYNSDFRCNNSQQVVRGFFSACAGCSARSPLPGHRAAAAIPFDSLNYGMYALDCAACGGAWRAAIRMRCVRPGLVRSDADLATVSSLRQPHHYLLARRCAPMSFKLRGSAHLIAAGGRPALPSGVRHGGHQQRRCRRRCAREGRHRAGR